MPHVVGLVGINGNVGKPTARLLVKAAEQDKIKLILFHRQGSNTSDFTPSNNVELKVLDLEDPNQNIEEAIKGVNVFVTTVGVEGLASQSRVAEALAKSPDLITYVPPKFHGPWSKEQEAMATDFMAGYNKGKELGLPMTIVYTGLFDFTFFRDGMMFSSIKENTLATNDKLKKNKTAITTMDHLAQTIADLVTKPDISTIKNKIYAAVSFWPTGSELQALYKKLHNREPKLLDWTPAEREAQFADPTGYGAIRVLYMDMWENDGWSYDKVGATMIDKYEGPGIEEAVRKFL